MSLNFNLPILFSRLKLLLSIVVSVLLNLFLSYQSVVLLLLRPVASFKSLIDSSSDSLSISSIDSLSDSLFHSLSDSLIDSLSDYLIDSLSDFLIDSLSDSLIDFLFDTLTISSIGSSSCIFMISSS